jgi:cyclophilin family peptidyl-prolyl cis-trans isomerase
MPKTSKRVEKKRASKIARAHATDLPMLEVKEPKQRKPAPGYKPPVRGIARYPWATVFILLIIALGVSALYLNHIGPFALPPKPAHKPKAAAAVPSPCLASSVLSQVANTSAPLSAAKIAAIQRDYKQAPAMSINTSKTYCAGINTSRGLIVIELDPKLAPKTVNNFVFLAQHHFYDGLAFNRVAKGGSINIIQGGDPLWNSPDQNKRGTGGPGYQFADEPVQGNYTAGTIAMANSGPNTNGSQFFVNLTSNQFPKSYNLFGHIVKGLDVANKIQGPSSPADPDYQKTKDIKPDAINYLEVVAAP